MNKSRAPLNRTITLTEEEKKQLSFKIKDEFLCENFIYNNDFAIINSQIPDNSVELILLDPPYNLTKKYGDKTFKEMSNDEYYEYIIQIIRRCLKKLKNNGTMYICGDYKTSYIQRKALEWCENQKLCYVINRITWARDKGRGSKNNWKNNIEDIYMVVKDKDDYYFNVEAVKMKKSVLATYRDSNGNNKDWTTDEDGKSYRMTCPSNVWFDITVPFWSMAENTDHPTQKPEKLYAKLILASSKEKDIVYEPFAGVCTGAVTAWKLGRNFIAVEQCKEYCLLGQKRLNMADEDKTIQGYEDGIFKDK